MGEKNGGRDSRALTGVRMSSAVLPQRALPPARSAVEAERPPEQAEAAARRGPLSAVLTRRLRSAQTPGGRRAVWFFFLGTALASPHCKHYWQQIGVV